MPNPNHPVFEPSHETTQEIDVDAALGFYDDDEGAGNDVEEPLPQDATSSTTLSKG